MQDDEKGLLHEARLDPLQEVPKQAFDCIGITGLYLKVNEISSLPGEIEMLINLKVLCCVLPHAFCSSLMQPRLESFSDSSPTLSTLTCICCAGYQYF
jgi:hypothetical protein